ncbi:hypothetical protein ACHAXA_010415 [Cyclostephanos tholiformis]|uniref:Uncharacterized protein n=1 Tax=Cyclostephanos tholiformis TaxID=382380 RepID=A0ABD3SF38_9STRA
MSPPEATYGPLSIDDAHGDDDDDEARYDDDDDADDYDVSSTPTRVTRWFLHRRTCACSTLLLLPMTVLAVVSSHVVVERYHMSFPNLLRTVLGVGVGGGSVSNDALEICASRVESDQYVLTSAEDLVTTRLASAFSGGLARDDDDYDDYGGKTITSNGFLWDDEDARTTRWRPQGVTTFRAANGTGGRSFALVSWYGRADEGYSDRGGRISFVDVSGMVRRRHGRRLDDTTTTTTSTATTNAIATVPAGRYPYEHVLLVDERFCTLPNIHVGGIEYVDGTLYVADSRVGHRRILEFELDGGLYETSSWADIDVQSLGHRYVLRMSGSSFRSPVTPSFLSYDHDRDEFVIGTYSNCVGKFGVHAMSGECFDRTENRLVWLRGGGGDAIDAGSIARNDYGPSVDEVSPGGDASWDNAPSDDVTSNGTNGVRSSPWHYFSEMQGAASAIVGNATVVWISSSYGPIGDSHLHVVRDPLVRGGHLPDCAVDLVMEDVKIFRLPPGLEDLHIERRTGDNRYMWMVTEFGTRRVFATRLEYLLP